MKFTNHYFSIIASLRPVGCAEKKLFDYYLRETNVGVQFNALNNDYFNEVKI